MTDIVQQFRAAVAAGGIELASGQSITPDGKLHRVRLATDKAGQRTGWYRLHIDAPPAGVAGDWRTGCRVNWFIKRESALTTKERQELAARILRERAEAQAETERRHKEAAARAARIWANAKPASPAHPYLTRKGIPAGIARGALVLPVVDFTGQIWGLQFIDEQGGKRFISGMAKAGHFIPSGGKPDGTRPVWITEGHATAATIQAMRPNVCTIAACDAGNLLSVALEARKRWPSVSLVIAGDFDAIGQAKALQAAKETRAKILPVPQGFDGSDWNDWANYRRGVQHGA